MPEQTFNLPLLGRAAEVRAESVDREARTIQIVWTTGATVQRMRWEGWDELVEYDEELQVDERSVRLGRLDAGAPFLNSHNAWRLENVLGSVVPGSVRLQDGKGVATIRLTDAPDASGIVQRIMEGTVRSVSVGYRVHTYEITAQEGKRELWRATDWEPLEVSAVAIPADPGAQTRARGEMPHSFSPCTLIRSVPFSPSPKEALMPDTPKAPPAEDKTRTNPPKTLEQTASPSVPTEEAPNVETVRAEERTRVSTITQLCRRHKLDESYSDDLIARGVSLETARSEILDEIYEADPLKGKTSEPVPAEARGQDTREISYRDALTNALQHRASPDLNKLGEDARQFRGMTLLELARHSLERRGFSTLGMSKMELATAAFAMRSAGYHATSDFPAILANVAGKTLRDAYDITPRTFRPWARRTTIVDFKPVQRTQLGGAPDLQKVLESGEFQYGTMGEGKEVYALATYGKIIAITRQALINDDLDAFTRIPRSFGASAADLESDIVYAILKDNPVMQDGTALFHAKHNNLGAAARIDETSLTAAYRAFGLHKGLEGRLISVQPRYIITPPGPRSVEARKQITATTPANTADVNAYAGRLEPIEEPRLIPASGQDPWFMAADPARIDTVEFAYLEGQEGVFTETRTGFEVDGIEIKARHDFAAKAIDHRGLYKNPGAAA
ncbi:prohead protease/major capsid protein fusion protein [Pseudovibrio sp. WM33]|uniref:prohead protease/major capsid protein fusion protein n=1 Tax=Pseudovibrio sp. WM33 TaxID=1735585 RepID=UPI0007AE38E3|nr:prohead protease/major capsid protein fusion protein [Pseudovibrio sp. WM33]KZL25624.1 Caudovirus prohead protease [Pseudovibrio sp. WM33]